MKITQLFLLCCFHVKFEAVSCPGHIMPDTNNENWKLSQSVDHPVIILSAFLSKSRESFLHQQRLKGYSLSHDQVALDNRQRCWPKVLKVDESKLFYIKVWAMHSESFQLSPQTWQHVHSFTLTSSANIFSQLFVSSPSQILVLHTVF